VFVRETLPPILPYLKRLKGRIQKAKEKGSTYRVTLVSGFANYKVLGMLFGLKVKVLSARVASITHTY
jgi:hypothetical protein